MAARHFLPLLFYLGAHDGERAEPAPVLPDAHDLLHQRAALQEGILDRLRLDVLPVRQDDDILQYRTWG
jgi:hypothetical protein